MYVFWPHNYIDTICARSGFKLPKHTPDLAVLGKIDPMWSAIKLTRKDASLRDSACN